MVLDVTEADAYVFDNDWEHERARLRAAELLFDELTTRHLERIGVSEGWRCLEVGAGAGSVAAWLAGRVGPAGRVVATDSDPRHLQHLSGRGVHVRAHDVVTDPLERDTFDLVHARMLLGHLPARDRVFERLRAAVRPGGWLLIEDLDFSSIVAGDLGITPARAAPAFARVARGIGASMAAAGFQATYGARLPVLVCGTLTEARAESTRILIRGGSPGADFLRYSVERLAGGDPEIRARDVRAVLRWLDDADFGVLSPALVSAWGRTR